MKIEEIITMNYDDQQHNDMEITDPQNSIPDLNFNHPHPHPPSTIVIESLQAKIPNSR